MTHRPPAHHQFQEVDRLDEGEVGKDVLPGAHEELLRGAEAAEVIERPLDVEVLPAADGQGGGDAYHVDCTALKTC